MDFVVTHRDGSGSRKETQYSAQDRKELYAKLKAEHISAISVREGRVKTSNSGIKATLGVKIGVFVFFIVLITGLIWFLLPVRQQPGKSEKSAAAEKNVPTDIKKHPARPSTPAEKVEIDETDSEPRKETEITNGWVRLPNGKMHKRNGLMKIKVSEWKNKSRYQIFDHYTDNEIATLLTLKPGESIIGGAVFPKDYEQRFLKSLETPIIVSKDDPEDIQEVKRAVIETRMQLKEALDNGEDIRKIMTEAYEESAKLAAYKDDIKSAFNELTKQENMALLQIVDTSLPGVAATRPNTALALWGRARPAGHPAARNAA